MTEPTNTKTDVAQPGPKPDYKLQISATQDLFSVCLKLRFFQLMNNFGVWLSTVSYCNNSGFIVLSNIKLTTLLSPFLA